MMFVTVFHYLDSVVFVHGYHIIQSCILLSEFASQACTPGDDKHYNRKKYSIDLLKLQLH